jgi:hypothetical protein
MAEPQNDWRAQSRDELHDPSNPPNALLRKETRSRALMSYVLPIVILFVIVGLGLIYWATRGPVADDERDESPIGTSGEPAPGAADPQPRFDDTTDELEFRGASPPDGDAPQVDRPARNPVPPAAGTDPADAPGAN